jgi:hypothetical protein
MDSSAVYSMFEEIKEVLKQGKDSKPATVSPPQVDLQALTAINDLSERLEETIEIARKPLKHEHRHSISIESSRVFLSLIGLTLIIIALSYCIGEQRRTISQYRANDLKYRYIKMQGKADENSIYRLERLFWNSDSVKIVRKEVEEFEERVMEKGEKSEKTK